MAEASNSQQQKQQQQQQNSFLLERFLDRLKPPSEGQNDGPRSTPASPALFRSRKDRQSISSAMPDMGEESATPATPNSRFHQRLWKWIRSKTKSGHFPHPHHQQQQQQSLSTPGLNLNFYGRERRRSSAQSVETHMRARFGVTRRPSNSDAHLLEELKVPKTATSGSRGSWADISIGSAASCSDRRLSSSRCLVPPPTNLSNSRDLSMESGYHSHSSLSTPSTPRSLSTRRRSGRSSVSGTMKLASNHKSFSMDAGGGVGASGVVGAPGASSPPPCARSTARSFMNWRSEDHDESAASIKRSRFFHANSVFNEAVEDDCSSPNSNSSSTDDDARDKDMSHETVVKTLGEWLIPHEELTLTGKKLVEGGEFGHDVAAGRWHGDVVVHSYAQLAPFLRGVRTLTLVRHENLVLYMGASLLGPEGPYNIITNPVKAESLARRLKGGVADSVDFTLGVAKQLSNALGYLHAKDIIHGRICARNVFLENKVQLSLLDYSVGCPNTVYSSPQVLSADHVHHNTRVTEHRGRDKADDVFAFGTLLFELFARRPPFNGESDQVLAAKVRAGALPRALAGLHCTDRLKRLIQRCWEYEVDRRPAFSQMVPHFSPGSGILRRHSTSEPRLDQLGHRPVVTGLPLTSGGVLSKCGSTAAQ